MNSRKALATFIIQILSVVISIVTLKITLYSLSPDDYGLFGFALSFSGLFLVISDLNLNSVYFKRIAEGENQQDHYSTYISLKLILVIVALLCFISYILLFQDGFTNNKKSLIVLLLVFLSYVLDVFFVGVMSALQAKKNVKIAQFVNILVSLVGLIYVAVFVFSTKNVYVYTLSLAFKSVIGLIAFYICLKNEINLFKLKLDNAIIKKYIKFVVPLLPMSILGVIYDKIDGTLVTHFLSYKDNGYFTAATRCNALLLLASSSILTILYSSFSKEYANNNIKRVEEISNKATKYISLFITFCSIYLMFYCDKFVILFMSSEYLPAVPIIKVYMFQVILMSVSRTFDSITLAFERLSYINLIGICTYLMGIILDFLLIPSSLFGMRMFNLGSVGPAYKALLVYICAIIVNAIYLNVKLNIKIYWRFILHIVIAVVTGLIVTAVINFDGINILLLLSSFIAFSVLYVSLLCLIRELTRDDLIYLYNVIKNR